MTETKPDSLSSVSEVAVGDRVWYRDYSGVLMALVAAVTGKGEKFASLSVLTRQGTWLGRPDSPRYDRASFGHPVEGVWSTEKADLL